MDPTEDLSARVLLKHILNTEPPRTPVTSSGPEEPSGSGLRRSSRFSRKDAEPQTPQNILRRSLKHKIHETITRKSLPATKRRTATVVLRKLDPSTSMLFNDDETPRHLLRNILQTEPVKSPVVHEKAAFEEPPPPSDDNTVTRTQSSIELSGLDLPDVTMGNVVSAAKGLSRKRPRRSLNVSAFEKRLKDEKDAEEESENSVGDHSSLSLSSSTSLSLKTPFVDVHTEKRGLKRRVSNRRKITEEEFIAALSKEQMGDVRRISGEDTNVEGITFGLSRLSEPEITADILNCDTALYDQPDAMTSNLSIIATQDKPTVMASQLQRDVQETQEGEGERSGIRSGPEEDEGVSDSQGKDVDKTEPQDAAASAQPDDIQDTAFSSKSEAKESAAGYQTFTLESEVEEAQTEEEGVAESQSEDAEGGSQSEEEEAGDRPQTEDERMDYSPPEEKAGGESQNSGLEDRAESEREEEASQSEEEEAADGSHTEDDGMEPSQTEEEDGLPEPSQTEEEDGLPEPSQTEEEDGLPETDEAADAAATSQSEEEEAAAGSQTEDEGGSEPQAEETAGNKSQCDVAEESEAEEDGGDQGEAWGSELLERDMGHVSRRAYRSEGGLLLPAIKAKEDPTDATAAGGSYTESKSYSSLGLEMRSPSHTGKPDGPQPSFQEQADDSWAEKDPVGGNNGSFHLPQMSHDAEVSGQESDASPEEAPAENAAEEEGDEEEEDDDNEEFPSKTPAFVREKRIFSSDPTASPSVFKNAQMSSTSGALPEAKPRQVRRRRTGPSRKEAVLPKTYLMSVFKHFAKTKVSGDVFPALNEIMDKFFCRVAEDLETYAAHAKRKTIEVEDVKLLLRRQGYINDKVPVEVLIEKYLRMEQRKMLIPIATSGNVVIPKIRK